jgi:pyrimidine-nucleoside phosphorylase
MNIIDIISKKRDGFSLTSEEILWLIDSYVKEQIPDYQMSALLMAIYFKGMNKKELVSLTKAMVDSGNVIDLSSIPGVKVDKHSTGGVGDKVSLILAPLVAAGGVPVPMMCGRALGHTGGTLDKLESIPGFRTNLSEKEFYKQIKKIGFAMMGQTEKVAPADRKIYALRDVTATVPSLPLICSSIISKKKSEGTNALVLDVKYGKGAFLKNYDDCYRLARELVELGNDMSVKTVALLTCMDQPLGKAVGNWIEIKESITTLKGQGPSDLIEVVIALGGIMLFLGGKARTYHEGMQIIEEHLVSGQGYNRFVEMIQMQGGDISFIENPESYLLNDCVVELKSRTTGYISGINALDIGNLALQLGAGRITKDDTIDYSAGILLHKKVGDLVKKEELLATFFTNKKKEIESYKNKLLESYTFSADLPVRISLIDKLIEKGKESLFTNLIYL